MSWRVLLLVGVVAFLGGLLSLGCSHATPFEKCLRARELNSADMRVQAAVSCGGDHACLKTQGVSSIADFVTNVDMCNQETTDGGGQ